MFGRRAAHVGHNHAGIDPHRARFGIHDNWPRKRAQRQQQPGVSNRRTRRAGLSAGGRDWNTRGKRFLDYLNRFLAAGGARDEVGN